MSAIMHRFLRLAAWLAGLLMGGLVVQFGHDNQAQTAVHFVFWKLDSIPFWAVAVAPLLVGVLAGYVYHAPARMHHFTEHMRHRGLVHDLRKENQELSRSLDRLLAMPNDDTPAIAAAAAARDVTPPQQESRPLAVPEPTTLQAVVLAATPVGETESIAAINGRRTGGVPRSARSRPSASPEAMKEVIAAAAAAMPSERHVRVSRPGRAPRQPTPPGDPN